MFCRLLSLPCCQSQPSVRLLYRKHCFRPNRKPYMQFLLYHILSISADSFLCGDHGLLLLLLLRQSHLCHIHNLLLFRSCQ